MFIPITSQEGDRTPTVEKVRNDARRIMSFAKCVIVLDSFGNPVQGPTYQEPRAHHPKVDCLVVVAPTVYKGVYIKYAIVLEIGFRRFVPYSQVEYRLNGSTKRGPSIRRKKGDIKHEILATETIKEKVYAIKERLPVLRLTNELLYDLMPLISTGIQMCVDNIIRTWTNTEVVQLRGPRDHNHYEQEACIVVRFPRTAEVLCAVASFAEYEWRRQPKKQLDTLAKSVKGQLRYFINPKKSHRHRHKDGSFSDSFVRNSTMMYFVADKLKTRVSRSYSWQMIEMLFELVGDPKSIEGRLIRQIWRVFKLPRPSNDRSYSRYILEYGEMKDVLLERWLVKSYRKLRLMTNRKKYVEEARKDRRRPYFRHARECETFSVFASKDLLAEMMREYYLRKSARMEKEATVTTPEDSDADIPWDDHGTPVTDGEEIPF